MGGIVLSISRANFVLLPNRCVVRLTSHSRKGKQKPEEVSPSSRDPQVEAGLNRSPKAEVYKLQTASLTPNLARPLGVVNKILLGHSQAHSRMDHVWLLSG